MNDLVEVHTHPTLHEPVLVVALEGWIDAGMAAAGAMRAMLEHLDTELVATFDTDALLDHRARRPVMQLIAGHVNELVWPAIELRGAVDANGRHVLFLVGSEPDHLWGSFCGSVIELALDLEVSTIIGLGAYPAPVPHTRPTHLALTSPSQDLLDSHVGFFRGSVEVPAGVQAAIEVAAYDAGIPALGVWAQVPHYIAATNYPAASLALVDGLTRVAGLVIDTPSLASDAAATRLKLDELVAGNPQHEEMVQQLEVAADSFVDEAGLLGPIPTADELEAELQRFLREQSE